MHKYIPDDSICYFEPDNIEDLAEQMVYMYNNPKVVLNKIKNSRKLFSKYSWQAEKARYQSFYEKLENSSFRKKAAI